MPLLLMDQKNRCGKNIKYNLKNIIKHIKKYMKLIICPLGIALQILLFISSPSKAQEKKNPNPHPNQKLDSIVVLKDSLKILTTGKITQSRSNLDSDKFC